MKGPDSDVVYCDGPTCDLWVFPARVAADMGWLALMEQHTDENFERLFDFCSWRCLAAYTAKKLFGIGELDGD